MSYNLNNPWNNDAEEEQMFAEDRWKSYQEWKALYPQLLLHNYGPLENFIPDEMIPQIVEMKPSSPPDDEGALWIHEIVFNVEGMTKGQLVWLVNGLADEVELSADEKRLYCWWD